MSDPQTEPLPAYRLHIELLSDTCFAAPADLLSDVDIEADVDEDGLPAVNGKTIQGLLRDTHLSLALVPGLDPAGRGLALLGRHASADDDDESSGLLHIAAARYFGVKNEANVYSGDTLRAHLRRLRHQRETNGPPLPPRALRDALLTLRTRTAQDRATDAPLPETLRLHRSLPKGSVLEARLTALAPLQPGDFDLLHLLCQVTRHVGYNRNRGAGLARWTLEPEKGAGTAAASPTIHGTGATCFLHLALTLTAPCLLSENTLDPNSRTTRPYLTGAALRGAVARNLRLYAKQQGWNEAETDSLLSALVACPNVRFLAGYPQIPAQQEGERSLPTPITWQRDKDARYEDADASDVSPRDALLEPYRAQPDKQRVAIETSFWSRVSAGQYETRPVQTRFRIHQRRDRKKGGGTRGRERGGDDTVFVYQALAPGETFRAVVAYPSDLPAERRAALHAALTHFPLVLGRSRRPGYGGLPDVTLLDEVDGEEIGPALSAVQPEEAFVVRLTADAVLRDPDTGQHDPYQLRAALEARFKDEATVEEVRLQTTTAQGFSRLYHTALAAVPAVQKGSVALLRAGSAGISAADLAALCARPLGERVEEGLGCFVVAPTGETTLALNVAKAGEPPVPADPNKPPAALVAAQRRLYRRRVRVLAGAEALERADGAHTGTLPSPSLLHRLREPLRQSDPTVWKAVWKDWLSSDDPQKKMRPRALDALREARFENRRLSDLLLEATRPDWPLPTGDWADDEQGRYCLLLDRDQARRCWQEVCADPALAVLYWDTLLSELTRKKQSEGRQPASAPTEANTENTRP